MKHLPYVWFDYRTDLPKWLIADIGQVSVEWSVLERELEEAIRLLSDVEIRFGRMLTTGMNTRSRMATVISLLQDRVYRDNLDPAILADFIKLQAEISEKIEPGRNLVIHGLWDKIDSQWNVLQGFGSRRIPELQPDIQKLARSVLPQRKPVTHEFMISLCRKIVGASQSVEKIRERVRVSSPPSRSKQPAYTRRRRQYRAHAKP